MGNMLIIKGADFSENGIQVNPLPKKDCIFTTATQQYVVLDSLMDIPFNKLKVKLEFMKGSTTTSETGVFGTRAAYCKCSVADNMITAKLGDTFSGSFQDTNEVIIDGKNSKITINGTEHSIASTLSSSDVENASLFAIGDNDGPFGSNIAGLIKINNVKIYNDLELIADIYPTINNNTPCLYDIVGERFFYELNNGVLAVE